MLCHILEDRPRRDELFNWGWSSSLLLVNAVHMVIKSLTLVAHGQMACEFASILTMVFILVGIDGYGECLHVSEHLIRLSHFQALPYYSRACLNFFRAFAQAFTKRYREIDSEHLLDITS